MNRRGYRPQHHRLNQWDEIAHARTSSGDNSIWYGAWTVMLILLLGLAFICSVEREHDARNPYQSSVTVQVMEGK